MNIYDAIMKAADQIERVPHRFDFIQGYIPDNDGPCGSPSCALGWISHFLGKRKDIHVAAMPALGLPGGIVGPLRFYARMEKLTSRKWERDALLCAKGLRLYADKYHKPTRKTDAELVTALMQKLSTERIPEDA